mmetsp:Transcript_12203/g.32233  ORF Transcript_12203/g.32233 Transcript_12203/m.32233 type:complete len:398 (-) Transcript_12203:544-1737(-)
MGCVPQPGSSYGHDPPSLVVVLLGVPRPSAPPPCECGAPVAVGPIRVLARGADLPHLVPHPPHGLLGRESRAAAQVVGVGLRGVQIVGVRAAAETQSLAQAQEADAVGERPVGLHRQEPVHPESAEDLREVRGCCPLVERVRHVGVLVMALDGRDVVHGELYVRREHRRQEPRKDACQDAEDEEDNDVSHSHGLPTEALLQVREFHHALDEIRERRQQSNDAREQAVPNQEKEVLVVGEADAVVDPGAMVVHPHDADVAHVAMMRPLGPGHVALPAHGGLPGLPLQARRRHGQSVAHPPHEVAPPLRHSTRVTAVSLEKGPHGHAPGRVEEDRKGNDQEFLASRWQHLAEEDQVVRRALEEQHGEGGGNGGLRHEHVVAGHRWSWTVKLAAGVPSSG